MNREQREAREAFNRAEFNLVYWLNENASEVLEANHSKTVQLRQAVLTAKDRCLSLGLSVETLEEAGERTILEDTKSAIAYAEDIMRPITGWASVQQELRGFFAFPMGKLSDVGGAERAQRRVPSWL